MCGFVGAVSKDGLIERGLLERQNQTLRHRGPDSAGCSIVAGGRVGLAHSRLSILDLSDAGAQPMWDKQHQTAVIFNGEIYNYRELREVLSRRGHTFETGSDTEVLLASYLEWQTELLDHLRGMFAFAIYDERRAKLFAARDAAGEKPLYYRHDIQGFRFASELKAILLDHSVPRGVDLAALEWFLAYGYVPAPRTIFSGIRKLPAAHALSYNVGTGELKTWRYWDVPAADKDAGNADDEELLQRLHLLLKQSIRRQLVADVDLGVLLSGGVDSSLIAAVAAEECAKQVRTYTITFAGHPEADEAAYARLIADYIGSDHVELDARPADMDLLPRLARQYDEPIADSSMIPTFLVSQLVRRHATVALGGDGGDELFGGYEHYSWLVRYLRYRRVLPDNLLKPFGFISSKLPVGVPGRNYLRGLSLPPEAAFALPNLIFDAAARRELVPHLLPQDVLPELEKQRFAMGIAAEDPIGKATRLDFGYYLPEDILVKVDRASMLSSLEVRAPFLDRDLVEFAFSKVPSRLKANGREKKILPKMLARRLLPPDMDLRRKQGFSLPLRAWFRGEWGMRIREILMDPSSPFSRPAVERLLAGQERGLKNHHRLFTLAIYTLWASEYDVTH